MLSVKYNRCSILWYYILGIHVILRHPYHTRSMVWCRIPRRILRSRRGYGILLIVAWWVEVFAKESNPGHALISRSIRIYTTTANPSPSHSKRLSSFTRKKPHHKRGYLQAHSRQNHVHCGQPTVYYGCGLHPCSVGSIDCSICDEMVQFQGVWPLRTITRSQPWLVEDWFAALQELLICSTSSSSPTIFYA